MALNEFIARRRSPSQHISVQIDAATARGLAIARSTADGTKGVLASSGTAGAIGFLFREVTLTGPDVVQRTQAWGTDALTHELEQPDKAGGQCTVEVLEKYEAEGTAYVQDSGTGAITTSTPLQSKIAFRQGKSEVLQGSDLDQGWRLVEARTAVDGGNAVRIVVEKVF